MYFILLMIFETPAENSFLRRVTKLGGVLADIFKPSNPQSSDQSSYSKLSNIQISWDLSPQILISGVENIKYLHT